MVLTRLHCPRTLAVPFLIRCLSSFHCNHNPRAERSLAGSSMGKDTGKQGILLWPLAAALQVGHLLQGGPEDNSRDIEEHRGRAVVLHQ